MKTSPPAETQIRAERDKNVLIVVLDGPQTRNSISRPAYDAIRALLTAANDDPDIGAIVLTGLHGFFSSGGNIANLQKSAQGTMAEAEKGTDALNAMIRSVRNCRKPVIAAVEGGAAGAGLSLALACDMLLAEDSAKFIAAYVRIGLTPDGGLTHFLSEGLPRQLVSEMCLTGAPISAARFYDLGVIKSLHPPGEVLVAAKTLAASLAVGPSDAMAVIKAEINAAASNDLSAQLELEASGINKARFTAESKEGLAAFLEKRKPDYRR